MEGYESKLVKTLREATLTTRYVLPIIERQTQRGRVSGHRQSGLDRILSTPLIRFVRPHRSVVRPNRICPLHT